MICSKYNGPDNNIFLYNISRYVYDVVDSLFIINKNYYILESHSVSIKNLLEYDNMINDVLLTKYFNHNLIQIFWFNLIQTGLCTFNFFCKIVLKSNKLWLTLWRSLSSLAGGILEVSKKRINIKNRIKPNKFFSRYVEHYRERINNKTPCF